MASGTPKDPDVLPTLEIARGLPCTECGVMADRPCRVTAGPYEGSHTSFHPARLAAARREYESHQEGTTP